MSPSLDLSKFQQKKTSAPATTTAAKPQQPLSSKLIKRQRRDEILLNIEKLPSLPTIINEVVSMANSANTDAKDFEEPFRKDQTLTAKLLKLVNSSFYALPNKIKTVQGAIVVLGFKTIKSLVLACGASTTLSQPVKAYGYDEGGLWKHSLATAALARHLAINYLKMSANDAEELFVAGLLHDIGKIAMVPELKKCEGELWKRWEEKPTSNITRLEQEFLGIDHGEVGAIITEKWKLGSDLTTIISGHHKNDYSNREAATVSLANLLASRAGLGLNDDYPWQRPISNHLMESVGLRKNDIQKLKSDVRNVINDSMEMLGNLN